MKYCIMIKKMKKFRFIYLTGLVLIVTLSGCKSLKEGLTGSKKNNNDEFLIEKKNPLTKPPDYEKLPIPNRTESEVEKDINDNSNIKKLLGQATENKKPKLNKNNSLEKSILGKIKNK